jgi:hypothetical protein
MFQIFVEVIEEKRYNYILWVNVRKKIKIGAPQNDGCFMAEKVVAFLKIKTKTIKYIKVD